MDGPHGPRRAGLSGATDRAGIDGDDATPVGEHGVEIEFAHLRHVGGELSELDEEQRDGVEVRGRHVTVGLEYPGHARARDEVARKLEIKRRSARALSSMTSTAVPPRPNTMTGPKVGSSAIPAINSRALGRRIIG